MDAPKTHCKKKTCLISVVAVTLFLCAYSYLIHHKLLAADYAATSNIWRSKEEMAGLGVYWPIYHLLLAMVVTCWFGKTRACLASCGTESATTCCPVKSGGLCFGLKLGLIMGLGMGVAYLYLPIPFTLAVKWFLAGFVEGLGIGAILGMLCKDKACGTGACGTKAG